MFPLDNVEKRILIALLVCVIASVAFIGIAWAYTDEDTGYSSNRKARSDVKGWYTALGHYDETYHKGQVFINATNNGWTKFRGLGGTSPYGWTHTVLAPGEYDELSVDPANVVVVETKTWPGEGDDFAHAYIAVGLEP